MCAEMLAQSQGPAFLQPGQLGDQIPMVVSRDRNHADASRQQNGSSQTDAEQAAQDGLQGTEGDIVVSRPAAGGHITGSCSVPRIGVAYPCIHSSVNCNSSPCGAPGSLKRKFCACHLQLCGHSWNVVCHSLTLPAMSLESWAQLCCTFGRRPGWRGAACNQGGRRS